MRSEQRRARRHRHHDATVEAAADARAALQERLGDRRARRRRETRDEILLAAREVLLERGAADLSLREIARRAGFSPGALYKYFDSKDDVVKALADRAMGALLDVLLRVSADLPPDERAVEIGLAYLEFARHNPEDVAVITMHESVAVGPRSPEHDQLEETLLGVFRDGAAAGLFDLRAADDAATMCYGAWALALGLATLEQRQRPTTAAKLRAEQGRLLRAFVNGLKSEREPSLPATTAPPRTGHPEGS